MQFIISKSHWDGKTIWDFGCGCAIGQQLARDGRVHLEFDGNLLARALAVGITWLTPALLAALQSSQQYPDWSQECRKWLRATLATFGHTLKVID